MNAVAWMIVACEVAVWIFIAAGLATRYIFKRKKLGLLFLALTPVVDLALLIMAGIDLAGGAAATMAHALAAVYIGVSIAFGKSMIQWADEKFLYYVMKQGEKPAKKHGIGYAKHQLAGWSRHLMAYLIGLSILSIMIFLINDATRTEALSGVVRVWSLVLVIDLAISVSYFVWPKKKNA